MHLFFSENKMNSDKFNLKLTSVIATAELQMTTNTIFRGKNTSASYVTASRLQNDLDPPNPTVANTQCCGVPCKIFENQSRVVLIIPAHLH